jgi:hypothetical protein
MLISRFEEIKML